MTLPLSPTPHLSEAARPYVPTKLPGPGPDHDQAARAFSNQSVQDEPLRERDLRERDLLGMAMASPHGVAAVRELRPQEFAIPVNQNVARAILDLADEGRRPDSGTVTGELRNRGQLPRELNPAPGVDPRTTGLGAWQTMALAPEQRAPRLAREIRSLYRQDTVQEITQTALQQYQQGLVFDDTGCLEADKLGEVTKRLADGLVSLPRELYPELGHDVDRSVEVWAGTRTETTAIAAADLGLPTPPVLSPAAQNAIRPRTPH